jgi:phosphatidylethanolamine-binding protein (PEBP) family uncharacterized protein
MGSATFSALAAAALLAGCGGSSSSSTNSAASVSATSTQASTSTLSSSSAATSTSPSKTTTSASSSQSTTTSGSSSAAKPALAAFTLSSPAFPRGGKIPTRYTCAGANESPPLQWQKPPAGTAQLFLFALDLAGGQSGAIRWAVGGISPSTRSFPAGHVPAGAIVGHNSTGSLGYAGVCPPAGKQHSVVFLLYALRNKLNLTSGFDPRVVQGQLKGNTAGAGLMFGTYKHA